MAPSINYNEFIRNEKSPTAENVISSLGLVSEVSICSVILVSSTACGILIGMRSQHFYTYKAHYVFRRSSARSWPNGRPVPSHSALIPLWLTFEM